MPVVFKSTMKIITDPRTYAAVFLFAIISDSDSFPRPLMFAKELFQPLRSFQFVFTVKSDGNPSVSKVIQNFAKYLSEQESPLLLRRDTVQIQPRLVAQRQPSIFVQVMLTQEPLDSIALHNPLALLDPELGRFNENVGIYRDIFLVFHVQAPRSRWALVVFMGHCLTPSHYHVFQVSANAELINFAAQIEPLGPKVYWVISNYSS